MRSLNFRHSAIGIFEQELLALAAEKKKFQDFCEDTFANVAGCRMLGTFYRSSLLEKFKGTAKLADQIALAAHECLGLAAIRTQVGIFLLHVGIEFIAKGVVVLKRGKSVHLTAHQSR